MLICCCFVLNALLLLLLLLSSTIFLKLFCVWQCVQVCGTDGYTYNSLCELQNQAAVRVDYPGSCLEASSDLCSAVASSGRCTVTRENCDFLVNLPDGCCPVCGWSYFAVLVW